MINHMKEGDLSGESEIAFSETEMEAAKQLMQLSEEDTLSCSSGTGWSVCGSGFGFGFGGCEGGGNTKRQEDVSSEINDMLGMKQNEGMRMLSKNVTDGWGFKKIRRNKKKKFRSLASIYRATEEMTRD